MNIPESTNDSLLELLIQPTEVKDTVTAVTVPVNKDDFEPEPKQEEIKPETPENNEEKPMTKADSIDLAVSVVDLIDAGGELALCKIKQKQVFGGSNKKFNEAKELARKARKKDFEPTEDEQILIDLYEDYRDYEITTPLEPKEKDMISKPLAEVLFKYQQKGSPETKLLMAVGIVYVPKILPLIFK